MSETITDKMHGVSETSKSVILYKYKSGWFTIKELARMVPLNEDRETLSHQSLYSRIKKYGVGHPDLMKPKATLEERSKRGGEAASMAVSNSKPDNRRTALRQHIKLESIPLGKYDNL